MWYILGGGLIWTPAEHLSPSPLFIWCFCSFWYKHRCIYALYKSPSKLYCKIYIYMAISFLILQKQKAVFIYLKNIGLKLNILFQYAFGCMTCFIFPELNVLIAHTHLDAQYIHTSNLGFCTFQTSTNNQHGEAKQITYSHLSVSNLTLLSGQLSHSFYIVKSTWVDFSFECWHVKLIWWMISCPTTIF